MKHKQPRGNPPAGFKPKERPPKPERKVFEKMNKEYWGTFRFYDSKGRRLSIFARPSRESNTIIVTVLKLSRESNPAPGDQTHGPFTGDPDRFSKDRAKEIYEKDYLPYIMGNKPGEDHEVKLLEGETIAKAMVRWAREHCCIPVPKQVTVFEYHKAKNMPKKEKKTRYTVYLKNSGPNKLSVVKCVKDYTGLDLKESKEMVDAAPRAIKYDVPKEEAEEIIAALKGCSAEAEMR